MFLFKEGSRNAFNNDAKEGVFKENYRKIFKRRLPHMDTVEDFLRTLKDNELEELKAALVRGLIEKRVFHKFKFLGKRFIVAVDGTGITSYEKDYCNQCLYKTYKNKKTKYFHHVLEAKLITSSGLCISLATEWIANEQDKSQFKKQDCERKAFKRLAEKLKKFFPRLPICIVADGLYPNKHFMEICRQMNWWFIVTLKDGNLKSVQEQVNCLSDKDKSKSEVYIANKNQRITRQYTWMSSLEYQGNTIHWVECLEQVENAHTKEKVITRFVHITNIAITPENANQISCGGRLRWKIENEGFNTQKNQGYGLEHKYSRVCFCALKNYYQCLQIAHMINQLALASSTIKELLKQGKKLTVTHIYKQLIGMLTFCVLDNSVFEEIDKAHYQIRLS